jgi:hypothetical protein
MLMNLLKQSLSADSASPGAYENNPAQNPKQSARANPPKGIDQPGVARHSAI